MSSLRGSTPNMVDAIRAAIDANRRGLHVALPGKVLEYDATKQTATVQPMVQQGVQDEDGYWGHEDLPEIYDVPVMFPQTAAGYMTFPIAQNDTGLLIFCERDIGQWRYTGQLGSPGDQRCHSLAGAVFYPGLVPAANAIASVSSTDVVIGVHGGAVVKIGGPSATDFAALASKVDTEIARIWSVLTGWTVVPNDGGAALQAAANIEVLNVDSVAATKAKVL